MSLSLEFPEKYIEYRGRPLAGTKTKRFPMDVRSFVWPKDKQVQRMAEAVTAEIDTNDEKAWAIQKFAVKNLKYVGDEKKGCPEFWLFPAETLALRKCDCEDGGILIASMLLSVLPEYEHHRVWVVAGLVKSGRGASTGGHAYCVYIRESDDRPVILDWCYYEDSEVGVGDKPSAFDNDNYIEAWFLFNHKESRAPMNVAMDGRVSYKEI